MYPLWQRLFYRSKHSSAQESSKAHIARRFELQLLPSILALGLALVQVPRSCCTCSDACSCCTCCYSNNASLQLHLLPPTLHPMTPILSWPIQHDLYQHFLTHALACWNQHRTCMLKLQSTCWHLHCTAYIYAESDVATSAIVAATDARTVAAFPTNGAVVALLMHLLVLLLHSCCDAAASTGAVAARVFVASPAIAAIERCFSAIVWPSNKVFQCYCLAVR